MLIVQGGIVQDLEENLFRKAEERFEDFKKTLRNTKTDRHRPTKRTHRRRPRLLNIGVAPAQLITQPDFSYQKFFFSIEYLINF